MHLLGMFFALHIFSFYKAYAEKELSDHTLTIAGLIACVLASISKPIWGMLLDCYDFKTVYGCAMVT